METTDEEKTWNTVFLVLAMSDISQVRASQQVGEITLDPKDAESAFVFWKKIFNILDLNKHKGE